MFTPVLAKHSKLFSLIDCISVGVARMQRNFEPMSRQAEVWQSELTFQRIPRTAMRCDARMNVKLQFTKGNSDGSKGRNDRGKQSAENAHYQTEQNSHEK